MSIQINKLTLLSKKGNFKAYPLKTAHIPKHKTVVIIRCKDDILIFFKQIKNK